MKLMSVLLAVVLSVGAAFAQPQRQQNGRQQRPQGMSAMFQRANDRLQDVAPRVGEPMPDVVGFDEQRQPLNLKDLKGSYAVLVSGCLT